MKSLTLKTILDNIQTISTTSFSKQLRYGTDSVKLPLKRQIHPSSNSEFNITITPKQQRQKKNQKHMNLKNDQCKNSQHQLPQLSSIFLKLFKQTNKQTKSPEPVWFHMPVIPVFGRLK